MQKDEPSPAKIVNATLVYVLKGYPPEEVLLGFKKSGFGQGKYVGFGGKLEPGESFAQTAIRELEEESGIKLSTEVLTYMADILFLFPNKPEWNHRVHAFTATHDGTQPAESSEMIPKWFRFDEIPYDQMWDDSHYWLPRALAGEKFRARFIFNPDNTTVGDCEFSPMAS